MKDLYKDGFFAAPRSLLLRSESDKELTAYGLLVLFKLLSHRNDVTGLCNPSQATIAAGCKVSIRTVGTALQLLIDLGYIAVDPANSKQTNAYVFLFEIPHPNRGRGAALSAEKESACAADSAFCADKQQNNLSVVGINNTTTDVCLNSEKAQDSFVTTAVITTPEQCSSGTLKFDFNLHNVDKDFVEFAESLLLGVSNAQQVLDEFNFQLGEKRTQGVEIRNPRGYLTRLVKLSTNGGFTPSGALEIARKRDLHSLKREKPIVSPTSGSVACELVSNKPVVVVESTKAETPVSSQSVPVVTKHQPTDTGREALANLMKRMGRGTPKEGETSNGWKSPKIHFLRS